MARTPLSQIFGILALLLWLLFIWGIVQFVVQNSPSPVVAATATPRGATPTPTIVLLPVADRAAAQRFALLQATPVPATATPAPTLAATATPEPVTPQPTPIPRLPAPATPTPTAVVPTPTLPSVVGLVIPTATPDPAERVLLADYPVIAAAAALGPCDCTSRDLNCNDFPFAVQEGASAQACFLQCLREREVDVHQLDADGDGFACAYVPLGVTLGPPTATPDPVVRARTERGACSCSVADYDCADLPDVFSPGDYAQACFEDCRIERGGDVFDLDADSDGYVCGFIP